MTSTFRQNGMDFFSTNEDYQISTLTALLLTLEVLSQAHFAGFFFQSLLQN